MTLFADDFETNQGWTEANLGASSGDWERGVPVNDPNWSYDPASDYDGSGSCYLTQNQSGNTDVDHGAGQLVSPAGGAAAREGCRQSTAAFEACRKARKGVKRNGKMRDARDRWAAQLDAATREADPYFNKLLRIAATTDGRGAATLVRVLEVTPHVQAGWLTGFGCTDPLSGRPSLSKSMKGPAGRW